MMFSAEHGRNRRWPGAALGLVLASTLALAGCGGNDVGMPPESPPAPVATDLPAASGTPSASPAPSATSGPPQADADYTTQLEITVTAEPGAEQQHYVLNCADAEPSADSNVPQPAAACELIEESAEALFFTERDPTLMCTEQYGGPQTATVAGTVEGQPVEAEYSRTDGCEISRWDSMEPLLGPGGMV